jgi:endonuclease-3
MARTARPLAQAIDLLQQMYGAPVPPPIDDPLQLILWENCAYLVDDERRRRTYDRLNRAIGTSPRALLAAAPKLLAQSIAEGGMHPDRRAAKLRAIAQTVLERFGGDLGALVAGPTDAALKGLQRFPGIGEPGAEKILLFARRLPVLALESNGLRVLLRLGYATEKGSYAATYRAVREATLPEVEPDCEWLIRAHLLLRLHGQVTCRRSTPECGVCLLAPRCLWRTANA